jgi:hypothetical protein
LYGTGTPGETITLYVRDNSTTNGNDTQTGDYVAVENTDIVVDENGNWSLDISNLEDVPVNDNEFFKATQTDSAGNVSEFSNTAHYYHGTFSNAATEIGDDFVMMGTGNDTVQIKVDDSNDSLVVDGGQGNDTAVFDGQYEDYIITTDENGNTIVTEKVSSDSDGNGVGDINELRNIETLVFADGAYNLNSDISVTANTTTEQDANNPVITGQTQAGSTIVITDENGNVVGEGTADKNGNYSITLSEQSEGEHTYTVDATDIAGNTTQTTQNVVVDTVDIYTTTRTETVIDDSSLPEGVTKVGDSYYKEVTTTTPDQVVLDTDAMTAQGIYEENGSYYKVDGQKQEEQTFTKTETHIVEVENPIMKDGTITQEVEVPGASYEFTQNSIAQGSEFKFDLNDNPSNIEIDFNSFGDYDSSKDYAKINFYDSNNNLLDSKWQSATNDSKGYIVPEGAVKIGVENYSDSNGFDVKLSYKGESTFETKEVAGQVIDADAMIAAGYTYTELEPASTSITGPQNVGNVGDGNVSGFNPEDVESATISLGSEYANRKVTLEIDVDVESSWDYNGSNSVGSTNDIFTITSNGVQIDSRNYSSASEHNGTELDNAAHSYTYEVFLDENGSLNLDFMVASTASDEVVNVNNIKITSEAGGWETTETVDVEYKEVVVVDNIVEVDVADLPTKFIAGETTTESVLIEDPMDPENGLPTKEVEIAEDTIVITSDYDHQIDMSTLLSEDSDNSITGIELGEGSQELNISLDDILETSNESEVIRIDGDESDSVNLNDSEWTLGETVTDDANTYQQYTGTSGDSTVTLEISTNIQVDES